ncbi:AbaSI family restriction endonuclease [Salipiger sp. PrR003]|uniref:AbaSI family restriction endonuclease n=1 Tax=Salipiger sp. PrR003 TaxID=2706776 RepID=UPI0013DBC051|nr:hypothetical protein [Salipiger sp. PrR003]NDV51479.1 hypothetical protein [Salipiger sp. PrR003]
MTSKADYILRSLAKTRKKRWEHYAISRIYHRLDDKTLAFVCQQAIRRRDQSKVYLADLYFPQLGMYLEIDEGHHASDEAQIADAKRRLDIAEAANLEEVRIVAHDIASLSEFDSRIDAFVRQVQERKQRAMDEGIFQPWDYENELSPDFHIRNGYVEVGPNALFRRHQDALACFGYSKGLYRQAVWKLPQSVVAAIGEEGLWTVWFPKLWETANWINSLSDDGQTITEQSRSPEATYDQDWGKRIVMAQSRDVLGRTLYRFVGVFEAIPGYTNSQLNKFQRVATRVRTFPRGPQSSDTV